MDLDTLKQRLKKYSNEVVLDIKEQGEVSSILYQGVKLSNKRYGPLWDLFKRYSEDKLTDKDVDNIEIIETLDEETEIEVLDEEILDEETEIEVLDEETETVLSQEVENLKLLFENNISKKVWIKYKLYKSHTANVSGRISSVKDKLINLYEIQGAQRVVSLEDIIEYKFLR